MAPATAAQAQQLLEMMKGLNTVQMQRLLDSGRLILDIARGEIVENDTHEAALYRYVPLLTYYDECSFDGISKYWQDNENWYVKTSSTGDYAQLCDLYGITDLEQVGWRRTQWRSWYYRVAA